MAPGERLSYPWKSGVIFERGRERGRDKHPDTWTRIEESLKVMKMKMFVSTVMSKREIKDLSATGRSTLPLVEPLMSCR